MFFDLTYNVKEQIISTLRLAFNINRNYRGINITDKFPQAIKRLPAIVIKNASYPLERAGVDDYIKFIQTSTGEVKETFRRGTSIKSVQMQNHHMLYCINKPEVFKIEILDNNFISLLWHRKNKRYGPVPVIPGTVVKDLIYDVDIEFDSVLVPGDFSTILLVPIGGATDKLYGGLVEMELSLTVMAESTPVLEELADLTIEYLWFLKKTDLEREQNILIKTIRHTGEEQIPEYKGNMFTAGIDISLRSQWAKRVPIVPHVTDVKLIDRGEITTCDGIPLSLSD